MALVALLTLTAGPAAAAAVHVSDLLADPGVYGGTEITLTGELVGDFQRRGDHVWAQLNDDPYALAPLHSGGSLAGSNTGVGVVLPTGLFESGGFTEPGGYRVRGPVVEVTGVWHFHDESRGGESSLAVTTMNVVERERPISEGGDWPVLVVGLVLVIIGLVPPVWRRLTADR
jgi:hypothetical protein